MELEEIKKQLSSIQIAVNEIRITVIGNEYDKESGFISRVKTLEDSVDKLERFKDRLTYVIIGMSVPTSYGLFKIFSDVVNIIK